MPAHGSRKRPGSTYLQVAVRMCRGPVFPRIRPERGQPGGPRPGGGYLRMGRGVRTGLQPRRQDGRTGPRRAGAFSPGRGASAQRPGARTRIARLCGKHPDRLRRERARGRPAERGRRAVIRSRGQSPAGRRGHRAPHHDLRPARGGPHGAHARKRRRRMGFPVHRVQPGGVPAPRPRLRRSGGRGEGPLPRGVADLRQPLDQHSRPRPRRDASGPPVGCAGRGFRFGAHRPFHQVTGYPRRGRPGGGLPEQRLRRFGAAEGNRPGDPVGRYQHGASAHAARHVQ